MSLSRVFVILILAALMPACGPGSSQPTPSPTPEAPATPLTTEEKARKVIKDYFEAKIKDGAEGTESRRYLFLSEQDPDVVSGKQTASSKEDTDYIWGYLDRNVVKSYEITEISKVSEHPKEWSVGMVVRVTFLSRQDHSEVTKDVDVIVKNDRIWHAGFGNPDKY